jgi:plasmid stabilization system protein ParE
MNIRYTPRAIRDLDRIWTTIADDNQRAANRVETAIRKRIEGLQSNPRTGVSLDHGNVRRIPLARYAAVAHRSGGNQAHGNVPPTWAWIHAPTRPMLARATVFDWPA